MPQNNKPPVDTIQMERLDHTKRAQNGHPSHVQGTDSPAGIKKSLYEKNGVAMCSQKRALFIATIVFATLFATSLIIAYTGPQSDCSCAGEKPANFVDKDWNATKNFVPIASNGQVFPWNNVRLPNFIRPSRYNITIRPNLTTLEVKGQVNIEFHLEKDSNFIVFHSKNLTITDKLLQDKKGHHLKIIKLLEYPRAEQMYLEIKDKFRKRDNYTLSLRYSTRLSRDLEGFYISSYMGSDGEKRYLATTHFEPTYARSAFPCFDEPQLKARFKISIFRDRFHIALCNMPVINTEDTGFYMGTGLLRDVFQESVEMSTYLVAFVVCDYTHVSRKTENNVFVSVYVSKGLIDQTVFALDTATKLMDYFENFFMVPYPLPKQDLIAIPDFAAGAMENWGLITYRETAILYDPVETSTAAHQWIAIVITHELAHQWFGNLVTMKWWNDLWLNEGFSSFLEYLGVDAIYPEWRMMEQFILDKTQSALQLDALASSHPISVSVHDPTEIEAIFDTISYNKGAAILYMLEKFLTRDTLRDGLKDYLNLYKYSNAETKDLWNVFSKHSNQSLEVKAIMDTWTQQMGYPLIRIIRNGNKFNITQERFLMISEINNSSNKSENSPLEHKWFVPLSYFTDREPYVTYNIWMNMSDATLEVSEDVQWIKVNVNQTGFYRVMYDESTMAEIITILKENHTFFSPADRANLIDDIFTLSRAGFLNTSLSLDLSLYLIKERDYVPWATAIKHLQTWSRCLLESNSYQRFLLYIRKLIEPVVEYVGWEDEGSHLKKLLRADILGLAVLAEMDNAVKEAISRFKRWMTDAEKIPPNLREVVYSAGVKYGGLAEWEHCWAKYNSTEISSERKLLLKAMGVASDPWLLQRYLMATLQRDLVKPQNVKILMSVVAANPKGQLLAWRHLKAYWSEMQSLFGNNTFPMGGLVSVVTSHLSSPYDYHEVSSYFKGIEMGSASRALDQSLERIRLNINWVKSNENEISEWLHEYLNSLK